jgi:hypothetical protein
MLKQGRQDLTMDALIEIQADLALEGYEALYPPEILDEMRRLMRLMLRHDPEAQALLKSVLRGQTHVDESHKVDVRGFHEARDVGGGEEPDHGSDPGSHGAGTWGGPASARGGRR